MRFLALSAFVAIIAAAFSSRPASSSVGDFLLARLAAKTPATSRTNSAAAVKKLQSGASAKVEADAGETLLGLSELNIERRGHTATHLANGKVLIVGGENAAGLVKKTEIFDTASRRPSAAAKLADARTGHTATRLADGRVIVIGGRGENGALYSTEIYNPATESFSPGPALNRARVGHSATVMADGRILVVGGDSEGSAELFDTATESFILIEPRLGAPRAFHAAALLRNGKVLIVGGSSDDQKGVQSAELFDAVTMRFSPTGNLMHNGRTRPTLRVLPDGKVQVIGGDDERSMEMFNPDGEYFTAYAHLLAERDTLTKILRAQTRAAFIHEADEQTQSASLDRLDEALDRSDYSLTEIPEAHLALVAGGRNGGGKTLKTFALLSSSGATVTTDKTDYAPGETVTITGSGWQPGETVSLVLHRETSAHPDTTVSAMADAEGNFTNQDFAPDQDDFGVSLTLTATGLASGYTAQTSFTDAGPPNATINVTTNITCALGGSFQITRVQQNGNSQTSGGMTPQSYGGLAPNSNYTITNIQPTVNGTTYIGPATITGTTAGPGSTTTVTLLYQDNTAPTITCPASITRSNDPNQCGAIVNYPAPTVSDNCAGLGAITCAPASGSFFPTGTTSVTCTVRDAANNPASCTFTVTVNDTQAPTITCPANVMQSTDPGQCNAVVNYAAPTVTDNCPSSATPTCLPASGSSFPKGTTTVTCNVSDAAGNPASCSFTVTVKDTEAPTVVCPGDIMQSTAAGQCTAVVNYPTPVPQDNCPGASVICSPSSGSVFAKGASSVTCTATDASGNTAACSFTVTVKDTEAPTITCPNSIMAQTDAGKCSAVVNYPAPVAADNCPGVSVSCDPAAGSTFSKGTTTVNCTATDTSSNTAACSFTVTVKDEEAPMVACPGNITTTTAPGQCSANVSFTATASDNCPGATVTCSPASGSSFNKGTTSVTCTAKDEAGNTSQACRFSVTVEDKEAPAIACPGPITQNTDPNLCSANVMYAAPTVSDNCPNVGAPMCDHASGSTFAKGTTTVNCTVTDASGNSAGCSFTVTVVDQQAPTITCPGNIMTTTDPGQCSAKVNYTAQANDNCPGVMVACNPPSGSTFNKGTSAVNCTATDASGNPASCAFTVTVADKEKPTIACPPNQTAFQDSAFGATVNYPAPVVHDNCPGVTSQCVPPSGSVFPLGATPVTCTATDTSGNTASCSFAVTVVPPPSTAGAKVTGGGSILAGGKATFGLTAMASSPTTAQGNVTYQDHATGMTVKSTAITAVVVAGTHARVFGKATINGAGSFDFVVDVDDIGEPGTSDTFAIQISNGYAAGGPLTGGNIQLH